MAYALTAQAQVSSASVLLTASGGTPGEALFFFRRDPDGVRVVREATTGLTYPSTGTLSVTDHEATQGSSVDYLLTDVDGEVLASAVGVTIPEWGTWLKSPLVPSRNVRVYLSVAASTSRAARREVVAIEGSDRAVVLSSPRMDVAGDLVVSTLTAGDADAVVAVLADGQPVLLDTPAVWRVPYRYVSVGDAVESRPLAEDDSLGLDAEARSFTLSELVAVEPPLGAPQPEPGWSYAAIPTLFDSYTALAASFESYDALAAGPA